MFPMLNDGKFNTVHSQDTVLYASINCMKSLEMGNLMINSLLTFVHDHSSNIQPLIVYYPLSRC